MYVCVCVCVLFEGEVEHSDYANCSGQAKFPIFTLTFRTFYARILMNALHWVVGYCYTL